MDLTKQIKYWEKGAKQDIETADILISKEKILQGLFFCHLSIEKILKAHFVKNQSKFAPKTHDLIYLLDKCDIDLDEKLKNLFPVLMKYQLEGRYPDSDYFIPTIRQSQEYLKRTKELLEWLNKELSK